MSVLNLTPRYRFNEDMKAMIVRGINYLIYAFLINDRNNIIYEDFVPGKNIFRECTDLDYNRLIAPNALNFEYIPQDLVDGYTLETEDVDGLHANILFLTDTHTLPVFNVDSTDNVLTDLLSFGVMNIYQDRYQLAFASLSLFNSLIASYVETEKTDYPKITRRGTVQPFEL